MLPENGHVETVDDLLDHYTGQPGSPEWQGLVGRELWAAVQLELYGDPPPATQRPFEEFGPPAPPEEDEVALPRDATDDERGETPVNH